MRAEQSAQRDAFLGKIGRRSLVMGILNLTPDSFSDGGRFVAPEAALAHAAEMAAAGCDIIDVGGESTRPGAAPVTEAEELARVEAILAELAARLETPLSIDTYKANVAARAIDAGAVLVNDVWGLQKDSAMAGAIAAGEAAVVIMHNRSEKDASLDILAEIRGFFARSLELAEIAGIPRSRIIVDPGIAFGKTARQNVEVIARLGELSDFGCPIMVGLSRKMFLGSLVENGIEGQLVGTVAANLAAAMSGAAIFRVHDVAEHVAAFRVLNTICKGATQASLRPPPRPGII
jgi:dihydropteroate synthase